MARRRVIVKQLAAIQNLGSIDVLCSDKTGTITTGVMVVDDSAIDLDGAASTEVLRLAWLNSKFETGIGSPVIPPFSQNSKFRSGRFSKSWTRFPSISSGGGLLLF